MTQISQYQKDGKSNGYRRNKSKIKFLNLEIKVDFITSNIQLTEVKEITVQEKIRKYLK